MQIACRVTVRGAAVTYLSHSLSFHSKEQIAPSNLGIKQLAHDVDRTFRVPDNPRGVGAKKVVLEVGPVCANDDQTGT